MIDYGSMTIDELDELSVQLKAQMGEIQEQRREIRRYRDALVEREAADRLMSNAGRLGITLTPGAAVLLIRDNRDQKLAAREEAEATA